MKKLLLAVCILLVVMPHQVLTSGVDLIKKIDRRVAFDLKPESVKYVNNMATAAGILGFGVAGACLKNYYNHSSAFVKIGITLGGACATGGISYLAGKWYATKRMTERKAEDEDKFNQLIALNNNACDAHEAVNLTAPERKKLSELIKLGAHQEQHRVSVYGCALGLQDINRDSRPIKTSVDYLDQKRQDLEKEYEAMVKISSIKNIEWDKLIDGDREFIIEQIEQNGQRLINLQYMLSPGAIKNWVNEVRRLPEYTVSDRMKEIDKEIKQKEFLIKLALAMLATPQGHVFQESSFCSFSNFVKAIKDNDRILRISGRKKYIRELMEHYISKINEYNKESQEVPEYIKNFVSSYNGKIHYTPNEKLLGYEQYLNHDNEEARLAWIEDCLSDE